MSADVMTRADVERAVRRALTLFDKWQRCTGAVPSHYLAECEGCIEDAVHVGIQAAMGIYKPLDSEQD